jgi:hypothetical protein
MTEQLHRDGDVVAALNRIAVALERIACQMEASDREGKGVFKARPKE